MERSSDIEERAGAWLAKRESGAWSAEDEACFTQWLDASTANRVAFLRQEAAWEQALRLQALRGGTPSGTVPSPDEWRLSPFVSNNVTHPRPHDANGTSMQVNEEREEKSSAANASESQSTDARTAHLTRPLSPRRRGAIAASLALAATGVVGWYIWSMQPDYETPVGGLASVPMSDGSKVTLNTDSAIRLAVTQSERRVQLERGEAFFDVAKDPNRPFVVSAGDKRVVAVGTKFSVRRNGNELRVFVTEGKVRFEDDSLLGSSRAASSHELVSAPDSGSVQPPSTTLDDNALLLAAGTIAQAGDSGVIVQEKPLREVEDYLSWRSGYLTFGDIPLADAVAEFNRYNERKIIIRDPAVATIRFSGKVRPTSSEGFVRLLESVFQIRAEHVNGQIVLTDAQASATGASVAQ